MHPVGFIDPFDVERGVAQGAVESPWIYSVFIDGLAQALKRAGHGIMIAGRRVPLLMYADDVVMLASTQSELVAMNAIATDFARRNRFEYNGKKSGVMVFNAGAAATAKVKEAKWVLFGRWCHRQGQGGEGGERIHLPRHRHHHARRGLEYPPPVCHHPR